jgi:hypothetical protein
LEEVLKQRGLSWAFQIEHSSNLLFKLRAFLMSFDRFGRKPVDLGLTVLIILQTDFS